MLRKLMLAGLLLGSAANATVESVEITERVPFADGAAFGEIGAYEKIRGVAHFALDPKDKANAAIVDLNLAPRDKRGKVVFQSEFVLLRPVNAAGSTLIYDINNRGNIAMMGQLEGRSPANNDPSSLADAGDGFLFRHGFSMLFSAWTWDVAAPVPGVKSLVFAPPVAKGPKGLVANEFTVLRRAEVTNYAGQRGLTYEPMVPEDPDAVLTERERPEAPRREIDRHFWHFVPGNQVQLEGGFQPGILYELSYVAKDPYVTGTGMAGIRDLLSYFRDHPIEGAPPPKQVLMFGISQSARVIARMLKDGLDVDEEGKLVFAGAYLEVPGGGGSSGFNSRFVQPTRHPSMLEEHDDPADAFPFTTTPTLDPVTGVTASRLDHARDKAGNLPKLMFANTSTEYWNRDASLNTTNVDGTLDVAPAPEVRVYGFMGAQHYVGRSHTRYPFTNCVSTSDHYLPMRALLLALDRWVSDGVNPPDSTYPQLADGSLTTVENYRTQFPAIALTPPMQALKPPRLEIGAGGEKTEGPVYESRVPAPDIDGNDKGGVRLLELQVPLGTHTGWNLRAPETGFAWATARWDGSFLPFARTKAEREAAKDPRLSLAERYESREAYLAKLRQAADRLVQQGFLLPEDVERGVKENVGLYDRLQSHEPNDRSCEYLFGN